LSDERLDDEPAHAPLGPSAAERWATCPDSINAQRGLPDEPSWPAAEGTAAHAISDLCLTLGMDATDFVGMTTKIPGVETKLIERAAGEWESVTEPTIWEFTWTDEDARLLQRGLDRVRALGGQFFGERRVDISTWTITGQFGTLDRAVLVLIDGVWWIYIIDLKWGRWPVYPRDNLQTILYGLGFWNDVAKAIVGDAPVRFVLEIDQPRCSGGGGVWETDLETMLAAGEWLRERAEATQQPNPPRVASEKGCAFCKAKLHKNGGCETYEAFNRQLIGAKFDEEPEVTALTTRPLSPEQRSFVLSHKKMITTWLDQLEAAELEDFLAGRPTPGRKAVKDTQKGKRDAWKSEKDAEAALVPVLGEKSFTKKLITAAQAGKQVSKEDYPKIAAHIVPGEAGKSMVPLEDARPALPVMAFDDEETEAGEDEK